MQKMFGFSKLLMILVYSLIETSSAKYGEFLAKQDRQYDVINFKVPEEVWKLAFTSAPVPLLKSPVTIVVPVHVADDEENEIEDEVIQSGVSEINVLVNETMVTDQLVTQDAVAEDPVAQVPVVQNPVVTVATVTEQPADVTQKPPQDITGQVFRFPCTCEGGQCGCCSGAILERFNLKACGNISFVPEDFVFDVKLLINNNTVVRRRVSASDPPPICFNPRRAPFVRVCVEISNIRIRNQNAFACLDINADIGGFNVYSASFRCFGLGSSGVQTGLKPKPVSSGPKPISLFGNSDNNQEGSILDTAGSILTGGPGGLFGQGSSGPLGAIGDAVGGLFGGRDLD